MVIERYENPAQIADLQITALSYNRLNKLKKVQPEAFFYWYLAVNT